MKYVVIASGPSITTDDLNMVKRWRERQFRGRVIVVNSMFERAKWADYCFFNDHEWFVHYGETLRRNFDGRLLSTHPALVKEAMDVEPVHMVSGGEMPLQRLFISPNESRVSVCSGGKGLNSGFLALQYAAQHKPCEIILLGFDHQHTNGKAHCHPDYPGPLMVNAVRTEEWNKAMDKLAPQLRDREIHVFNASRETSLTCFPRKDLKRCLRELVD